MDVGAGQVYLRPQLEVVEFRERGDGGNALRNFGGGAGDGDYKWFFLRRGDEGGNGGKVEG